MTNDPVHDEGPLPPTWPYEQINSLCESFSNAWKPEARPAFDDYLRQVAENTQPTLLRKQDEVDEASVRFSHLWEIPLVLHGKKQWKKQ